MDTSSELVHSLLPVFMASVLGASMVMIGVVEGVAEAAAAMVKVFSGTISDHVRKRKPLVILGYGLSALTKPVFPLAGTIGWVFGARFVDRLGKGIRGAPRDALIADVTPAGLRGAAFGLRQALDSVGALLGPALAVAGMMVLAGDIASVMWVAVVPAFFAVVLLAAAVREPDLPHRFSPLTPLFSRRRVRHLPVRYWYIVVLGAVFTLARFSEAFLILRAQDVGLSIGFVPAIMIVMNLMYALFAFPAGAAADRFSARTLLVIGLGVLVVSDALLMAATGPWAALAGAACWGLHMALTQGLLSKLVADAAPAELRGTAFGIFNMVSGGALLLASLIAGLWWSAFGAAATFLAGALFAGLAAAGLMLVPVSAPASRTSGE